MSGKTKIDVSSERDMVLTRLLDAPLDLVWAAWTEPKHLAAWWGPASFTNPVCIVDLKPGGKWRIVMQDPQGKDYPITGETIEVEPKRRLVVAFDTSEHGPDFVEMLDRARGDAANGKALTLVQTVTFEAMGAKTRLTVSQRFPSSIDRDANAKLGAIDGWTQSFEKLDELLPIIAAPSAKVVPHLVIDGAEKAIAFYEKALGARVEQKIPGQDGKLLHAALLINGAQVFLTDDHPAYDHMSGGAGAPTRVGGTGVVIHLDVPDVDAAHDRMVKAGAKTAMAPENMFWGQRYAKVRDPFGHVWSFGGPTR